MTDHSIFAPITHSKHGDRLRWGNLAGSASSLAVVNAAQQSGSLTVLITNDTASAFQLEQELRFYRDGLEVLHLPDWETLPYDTFSPHEDIISERLTTLHKLKNMHKGLLIIPISTLMHRLLPQSYLDAHTLQIQLGQTFDIAAMRNKFEASGYRCVDTVYEHGEFALRGAIMDIYPMGSKLPYRIDLLGDEIDTLRTFDPETQRTVKQVKEINLLPGKEFPLDKDGIANFRNNWHQAFDVDHSRCPIYQDISQGIAPAGIEYYLPLFFDHCSTLFDYLPDDSLFFSFDGLDRAAEQFWRDLHSRYEDLNIDPQRPLLAPNKVFIPTEELFSALKGQQRIVLFRDAIEEQLGSVNFPAAAPPFLAIDNKASRPLAAVQDLVADDNNRILFCAESAGRRETLTELLGKHKIRPGSCKNWAEFIAGEQNIAITVGNIESGLRLNDVQGKQVFVIAEAQLFGQQVMQKRRRRKASDSGENIVKDLTELTLGAPVVHLDHGVGRYHGLQTIEAGGVSEEFITLEYADGAKLYVPVSSLDLISRYTGADVDMAPLHRLGSDQWSKAKRKAAEKIRDVAAELLDIYARRAARPGQSFNHPEQDYQQFAAAFPFEETPDQQSAIEAVIADMQAKTATDRLVCGDVGFGKTEVAMRAAFIAAHNNKQVAVLVPTTLLAQQHHQSFKDRFADWPVNIEVISRFKTAKEQSQIIADTAAGKIDILVGTHKLLNDDVKYHDLGLVIIDEEHRFGVRQKEKLKSLRSEVDILTLTATPIPRTLNMAMSGMRDLSIIATPPARRLSVKTFVRERDKGMIKEALLREILRGGQVYYLHNEVKDIDRVARELQELAPELRIGIGHGQMHERELEQVMSDFYHKRYNVLLCTTIIETGIDVPSANTIIIDRADKFGLAQLHQLRGRVGRSHHQAYAYLLTPGKKNMTSDAKKRLEAISMAEDLGAGFMLATHDLEIRGAGELLGDDQSGQIHSIGFTLYMEMLERAVKALKAGKQIDLENPIEHGAEINLRLPALIPDDYLPDVHTRLTLYKRIASAETDEALRELQVEMIDRFGLLPEPVKSLFRASSLKLRAHHMGIAKIEAHSSGGKLEFCENTEVDPLKLVQLVQSQPATFKLAGATTLRFDDDLEDRELRFQFVEDLITLLAPKAA
ncbi:transcription-repair coupling factor [Dasania sp. GY-MA-18]|uniref:Transcription-repair-coupling factor n=1 Tax=Dasania phycosphaerae TaxID=2950436 RepID=A0A9J6RIQ4_9GAMM|nr:MULTISPECIES: transcription-repair coupling factor [Dasania]MCR8921919.1 transcription-repair coupling factor [Dasania sp. GY-MA-18]MCZ0864347.1 transcription-repair coupling factor [Dasania phycosphaerae]MCZ0868075.1 transcription-repair coupling factor [Dasania phycosphaerae]